MKEKGKIRWKKYMKMNNSIMKNIFLYSWIQFFTLPSHFHVNICILFFSWSLNIYLRENMYNSKGKFFHVEAVGRHDTSAQNTTSHRDQTELEEGRRDEWCWIQNYGHSILSVLGQKSDTEWIPNRLRCVGGSARRLFTHHVWTAMEAESGRAVRIPSLGWCGCCLPPKWNKWWESAHVELSSICLSLNSWINSRGYVRITFHSPFDFRLLHWLLNSDLCLVSEYMDLYVSRKPNFMFSFLHFICDIAQFVARHIIKNL